MVLMLFSAIAVAGLLGTGYMTMMKGPGKTLSTNSKQVSAENAMEAATRLVIPADPAAQDCDGDGIVEPLPYLAGAGPVGGGLIPSTSGANKLDPWGTPYGYCVWDHGKKTRSDNVASCGGSTANRLQGGNVSTEYVMAIVSAGPDKTFQTTCNAYADANADNTPDTPLIVTQLGSDDIVRPANMDTLIASGTAQLQTQPDSACVAGNEGMTRYDMGVMQLCTTTGWKEVGASVSGSTSYTTVTNQPTATPITSNAIVYTGFFGTHDISVDNGAVLVVNGVVKTASTTIVAGDSVAIRVTTTGPQITTIYTVKIGAIQKQWSVTTRNKTAAALSISPATQVMNVSGTSGTVYSSAYTFTITNTGETTTNVLNAATLSSLTNFEFTGTNTCTPSVTLAQGQTCTLQVRSKASPPTTTMAGSTLSITATGATTGSSSLSGTASGWSCVLDSQTTLTGNSRTYYSATTSASCASIALSRLCTDGTFNGSASYQYATCVVPPCSGTMYAGYCWHFSADGASCDATCASFGGNTAGTVSYAAPNMTQCSNVVVAMGYSLGGGGGSCGGWHSPPIGPCNSGCSVSSAFTSLSWVTTADTATGGAGFRRVCSCAN